MYRLTFKLEDVICTSLRRLWKRWWMLNDDLELDFLHLLKTNFTKLFPNRLYKKNIFFFTTAWKVPVFGFFLVRIFSHWDWIRGDISVFILNAGKYGPEKLRIWALFKQWSSFNKESVRYEFYVCYEFYVRYEFCKATRVFNFKRNWFLFFGARYLNDFKP